MYFAIALFKTCMDTLYKIRAKPQKTISFPFTGGMTPTQTHLHFNTHKKPLWDCLAIRTERRNTLHTVLTDWTQSFTIVLYSIFCQLDLKTKIKNDLVFGQKTHCEQGYKRCFRFPFRTQQTEKKWPEQSFQKLDEE